ncbi:MAG: hypothetical protein JWQ49_2655 [Edaphobacter sp.]|nr:hypothetical protein [Edaphobacter sp.]
MNGYNRFPGECGCRRGYLKSIARRGFSLEARHMPWKRWLIVDLDAGQMVPACESGEWL